MTTQPKSRRIAPGVYETPTGHTIQHAWTEGRNYQPVRNGWNLIGPDGEWWGIYATKADAIDSLLDEDEK